MKNDKQLLELMLADERRQPAIYRPGPYWRKNQSRIVRAVSAQGIEEFREKPAIGKGWADTLVLDPADLWPPRSVMSWLKKIIRRAPVVRSLVSEHQHLVRAHYQQSIRHLSAYYELHFGEWLRSMRERYALPVTLHGSCQSYVTIDGTTFATRYLDDLMRIYNYSKYMEFGECRAAMEIGGGFGANAHLLLTMHPNIKKYIYLDIPPMIYVATQYLRHFFPDAVVDYRNTRDLDRIAFRDDDSLEILCLCTWQIEKLDTNIDLFWNSCSFSEMTTEIVQNYASFIGKNIDRERCTLCLLMNKTGKKAGTVGPAAIIQAFEDDFTVEEFEPEVEHLNHPRYHLGRLLK